MGCASMTSVEGRRFESGYPGVSDRLNSTSPVDQLPLHNPDYTLAWPREVFLDELRAILARLDAGVGNVGQLLLEEAFVGSAPSERFRAAGQGAEPMLSELLRRADELQPHRQARRPYFIARTGPVEQPSAPDWDGAKRRFTRVVNELDDHGYFDLAWGLDCVDGHRDWRRPEMSIEDALGIAGIQPLGPSELWSEALFLSAIEVLHDLVARPRNIFRVHDLAECGRHYSEPAPVAGQAIYRAKVNEILDQSNLPYRLASGGEDSGRVVAFTNDARESLAESLVQAPPLGERDELLHAIALFRGRGADRETKRSAVVVLARILERHRKMLKSELLSRDERALFQIANDFDLRHSNQRQLVDYDDAFLDWVFWWYLATIDLLRSLLARS